MIKSKNITVLVNILSIILVQGVVFFTAPIFSRILGTRNYGIVQIFNTWGNVFEIVFSVSAASTIVMAINEFSSDEQYQYQSSIMFLLLLTYGVGSGIMIIFMKPISLLMRLEPITILMCVVCSLGKYIVSFANSKYIYEFKAIKNFLISFCSLMLTLIFSFLLIPCFAESNNYYGRIIGLTMGYGIVSIFIIALVFKKGQTLYNKIYWKFCIKYSLPVIFHSLSNIVLGQSDRIMIQAMISTGEVGIYSLAYNFGSIITIIYGALNNSWNPFYFSYLKNKQYDKVKKHASHYVECFLILVIGFLFLHPEVYHIFASKDYWNGARIIPVLSFGFFMMFLYSLPVNYEFFYKKTFFMAIITACTAMLNIVLNYFFIIKYGSFGAAVSTAITYFFEFVFHYFYVKRYIHEAEYPLDFKFFVRYIMIFISFWILFYIIKNITLIRWTIGISLGIVLIFRIYKRKTIF